MTARSAIISWAALMALLTATVLLSFVPMGVGNLAASLLIAVMKAAIIMAVFMKLGSHAPLHRLAVAMLAIWLALLIGLTFADYVTRPTIDTAPATSRPGHPVTETARSP